MRAQFNSYTHALEYVHCILFTVQFTVHSGQHTAYSVQCTVYSVQFTVYSVQCTVYSVQLTAYIVQCTVLVFHYTVCTVHTGGVGTCFTHRNRATAAPNYCER